jgi:membrane protease YdiL (CAAX protease family)
MPPTREHHDALEHLDQGRALDDAVAAALPVPAGWGWGAAIPILAFVGVLVGLSVVVVAARLPTTGDIVQVYNLAAELLFGAAVVLATRRLARRVGGWAAAVGLDQPRREDAGRVVRWFLLQLAIRISVLIVLHVVAPGLGPGSNVRDVHHLGAAAAVVVVITAVVLAPVAEEIAFRGLLLRAFMRRLHFWPSAALSSLLFALLHVPGSDSVGGIVTLTATIYAFAMVQCELVRRAGRLVPAIGVHASVNALVTLVALTT